MVRAEALFSNSTSVGKGSTSINLARLCAIRWIVLISQGCSLLALLLLSDEHLDSELLVVAMVAMGVVNGTTQYQIRNSRIISEQAFFVHLLIDVAYLTVILYLAGGSTNPFVSYYLIPLIISAAVLEQRYTWVLAGLTLVLYTALFYYSRPLGLFTGHGGGAIGSPHFIGMWVNFGFSALLISFFVVRMAQTLQAQAEAISDGRERALRDEQILGVASLAAGTAHELRTPLTTVTVLVRELRNGHPDLATELELIETQVERCEDKLKALVAGARTGSNATARRVGDFLNPILDRWRLLKPEVELRVAVESGADDRMVRVDQTFDQAMINLLNNAAEASPSGIALRIICRSGELEFIIEDEGEGISSTVANDLGKVFVSDKEEGLGMGVLLSQASVERLGGRVEQFERPTGGLCTRISLPEEEPVS